MVHHHQCMMHMRAQCSCMLTALQALSNSTTRHKIEVFGCALCLRLANRSSCRERKRCVCSCHPQLCATSGVLTRLSASSTKSIYKRKCFSTSGLVFRRSNLSSVGVCPATCALPPHSDSIDEALPCWTESRKYAPLEQISRFGTIIFALPCVLCVARSLSSGTRHCQALDEHGGSPAQIRARHGRKSVTKQLQWDRKDVHLSCKGLVLILFCPVMQHSWVPDQLEYPTRYPGQHVCTSAGSIGSRRWPGAYLAFLSISHCPRCSRSAFCRSSVRPLHEGAVRFSYHGIECARSNQRDFQLF